jgi:hypothetical protein
MPANAIQEASGSQSNIDESKNSPKDHNKEKDIFPNLARTTSLSRMPSTDLPSVSTIMSASKVARQLKQKRQKSKDL